MGIVTVIAILFNLAGIGCGVVSLATTSWITPGYGLFQTCKDIIIVEHCSITIGDDEVVLAVACLVCVGLFLSVPAVVLLFVDLLRTNRRKVSVAGALLIVASILVAAGVGTYTALRKPEGIVTLVKEFGYSYYMAWGSCGALFLASILAGASSRETR